MNDQWVDHIIWFSKKVTVGNRSCLQIFNIVFSLNRSITGLGQNDPCFWTIFLTYIAGQQADISHIDHRRCKWFGELPVCIRPETRLCQWRTVWVICKVPLQISTGTYFWSKRIQHFSWSKGSIHIICIPQMIKWNINSCIRINTDQCIIGKTKLICINLRILSQCLGTGVIISVVIIDFISDDPVGNLSVFFCGSTVTSGQKIQCCLQLLSRRTVFGIPGIKSMSLLASLWIDQAGQVTAPTQKQNSRIYRWSGIQCKQLSVVIRDRIFYKPVSLSLVFPGVRVPGILKCRWCDQLTEINIDHRISYIQFFRIFHHVSIDLKSLFGDGLWKTISIFGQCTGVGNKSACADIGIFPTGIPRSDSKTGIQKVDTTGV